MNPSPVLELREKIISLPGALNRSINVSLQLRQGEICVVTGPNGSGKSTFLKWVNAHLSELGLTEATTRFLSQGADEDFVLPSHLIDLARCMSAESNFDGEDLLFPEKLWQISWNKASLGERQRALLSGVMQGHPKLLLLDEPTSALDSQAEKFFWSKLKTLCDAGTVALVVYHGDKDELPDHKELCL